MAPNGSAAQASAFHAVIDACNKFDGNPNDMWKFYILNNSQPVGYIPEEFMAQISWKDTDFIVKNKTKSVILSPALRTDMTAVEACQHHFRKFCEVNRAQFNGCLDKWLLSKNPSYQAIRWVDHREPMFTIPTPLRGIFGIATAGVHLNVYTTINQKPFMWVSYRSLTASYPGMMDQIVAGGMDPEDGYEAWKTLEHEAWEEAGLVLDSNSYEMTHKGVKVGTVQGPSRISFYDRKNIQAGVAEQGHIEPGVRFVFDLEVSPDFTPTPGGDEHVGSFRLKPMDEVKEDLLRGKWKPNSALTTLDFLLRKGYVTDDGNDEVKKLRARLQVELPMETS
ncbi:thiamin pyrophosphokinase, putative [Cordyceps militaris CM01]|uniref:Thiamin pyrophosphokinase, putative n=1 Tax=Cordyceps militaris (strain CM01) TaxID=983644 RepID=G3J8S5_CORMM|nr:thiamine pyrophosphokinase, putative [Cordyceps militaris CM01]EGX94010.1 thiamin pyrophosphokinase, putative [Cordyceps militaris CM01]